MTSRNDDWRLQQESDVASQSYTHAVTLTGSLLLRAYQEAAQSRAPRTQVGAVIVRFDHPVHGMVIVGSGHNRKSDDGSRWIHGEINAIDNAVANGENTHGAVMYATWAACTGCARAIIDAGIREVVTDARLIALTSDRWTDEVQAGFLLLRSSGVIVHEFGRRIGIDGQPLAIRFDGKAFTV